MGGDWFREDTGFTEEARALQAMRELREIDCPTGGVTMMILEKKSTKQATHTPTFKNRVPDGYLRCRDCGQVLTMEQWVSVRCERKEG